MALRVSEIMNRHSALTLATEEEIARLFPDCEAGAIPPFGNLYDLPTFVDACLCEVPEIFFNAGSRRDVVGMRVADYVFAARPMLGQFCVHAGAEREPVDFSDGSRAAVDHAVALARPTKAEIIGLFVLAFVLPAIEACPAARFRRSSSSARRIARSCAWPTRGRSGSS